MLTFKAHCPHCGTRGVMFAIQNAATTSIAVAPGGECDVFARCGHCDRGVVARYSCHVSESFTSPSELIKSEPTWIAPAPPDTGAPPHTPERAAEFYRQGMENLPQNPDAAGAMFRKALETALRERFPAHGKMTLSKRIQTAAETGDLAEWSHQIRLDGNCAAHDCFTSDQARDMTGLGFTDRIVEIATLDPDTLQPVEEYDTLINPLRDIPGDAIHGLTASDLEAAPTFSEIAPAVATRIDGAVLIAHNAVFDARMLAQEFRRGAL